MDFELFTVIALVVMLGASIGFGLLKGISSWTR